MVYMFKSVVPDIEVCSGVHVIDSFKTSVHFSCLYFYFQLNIVVIFTRKSSSTNIDLKKVIRFTNE